MSASSVYNALNNAIDPNTKTINLWKAANESPDLAGIIPVLGLFAIKSDYILGGASVTLAPSGTSVLLTGTGAFDGGKSYAATATLHYVQEGNVFSLALTLKTDWVFSDFFPKLPETFMEVPQIEQGVRWYDSILINMSVNGAVFTGASGARSLWLNGSLLLPSEQEPDKKHLLDVTPMIGPWPLRLTGTVTMPDDKREFPLMDLDAMGNNTVIDAPQGERVPGPGAMAIVNPGLNLIVAPLIQPQPGRIAFSTIKLYGDFALGEIEGRISVLILSVDKVWNFIVLFKKETASLVQGLAQLISIFGVELPVPMNFPVLSDFYVAEVDMDLENKGTNQFPNFTLLNLGMSIRSDKVWHPPVPFVTISNVGTRWVWSWSKVLNEFGTLTTVNTMTGSVFGTMNFGSTGTTQVFLIPPNDPTGPRQSVFLENQPVSFDLKMTLPDFIITGTLSKDSYISITDVLSYFFGNGGPSTGKQKMNITQLKFSADPIGQNYFATASILFGDPANPDPQQGWEIDLYIIQIILNELSFEIAVNSGSVSGGITGVFYLDQYDPTDYKLPRILLSAEYPPQDPETPQGWTLTGKLYEGTAISLTKLIYQFIYGKGQTPPDWTPDVTIDRLSVVFTTGNEKKGIKSSYVFGATISARWQPTIFNTPLSISASAIIDVEKPATSDKATGSITGRFSVNKIMLEAALTFGVPEATYRFKVQFDQIWLQATTSWRGEQPNRHQVISLQLGGVTLGDILEYLVNLAAPTLGFKLDSPWDLLKKVDLSRFVLTIDPTDNIVEFVFNANVDLVVAQLNSIGVRYSKKTGQGKVDLILTGNFLGQRYTPEKPLSWDVVNDPPPQVPGQGTSLVDLRYMGLGQRVTFKSDTPNTVRESIAKLRKDMTPPPEKGNPMPQTMSYSAESQWLIGLDLTIMDTVDLGFIFNDPKLYGLSIGLNGERAGGLAGLKFEILYKKITDEIGMFRVEFQVPDMFRTIQLGVVSITLGIIVIEIYTNGNFKIDLGFPYNRNFERSFSLQAYIFIGRGGFYFGLLNGDTSTQVPRITNGTFSPVIELGVGIAAGVGREIRAGILSGGAFVELQVIFQGVLAWFNPSSAGAASVTYFKCQGIAALYGKIYGSVDFAVVKVSVTLEAYAQISIIYESYQPMVLTLSAGVRAQASIKILFIRIHFSFSVNVQLQFVVGSAQPTPWILANNSGSSKAMLAAQNGSVPVSYKSRQNFHLRANNIRRLKALKETHQTALRAMGLLRTGTGVDNNAYILNWKPDNKVFPDSPRKAHLTLIPMFTVGDVPISWNNTIPPNNIPNYRAAFVLFADTGMAPTAATAAECVVRNSVHSGMMANNAETDLLAADILTQGLMLYAIDALPRDPGQGNTITAGQIELLLEQLDMPETMSTGMSISDIATFFSKNINLWISGDTEPKPDEKSAMTLPMPPFLSWRSAQGGDTDFSNKNKIGPWYEWEINNLLNAYYPVGAENSGRPAVDDPAKYESFTSFMFRDFCLMLIENGVKEMQKHLDNTTVTVQEIQGVVQSLDQIAAALPSATVVYMISSGDTVESVAEHLGATTEELLFLNPGLQETLKNTPVGTNINIVLGVAPEVLALDNAEKPFAIDQCMLGTLVHQAATGDTLQKIATLFQVPSVADMLAYHNPQFPDLSSGNNVLNSGSKFDLLQRTFSNAPADFTQVRTAGAFFTRYTDLSTIAGTVLPDMANWYAQVIAELNQGTLQGLFSNQPIQPSIELPPGNKLTVPNLFQAAYKTAGNTNQYTTIAGDTLELIGFTLAFEQDFRNTTPPGIPQWPTFRAAVTPAGAQSWNIPAQQGVVVQYGDTIERLVRHLVIDADFDNNNPRNAADGLWIYNWPNVAVWLANANVLAPVASITVPDAKTAVFTETPLSFDVLTNTYGLAVSDAATRLKGVHNLFGKGTVLLVKHLPAQDINVLIDAILVGDSFVSIVNQSSRMLMSGLQLPGLKNDNGHIIPDKAVSLPLYDLTGQQFNVPVNKDKPTETALALALSSEQPWIELFNSITVVEGDTLPALEEKYKDLLKYNPGLNQSTFRVGMILLTAPSSPTLDYSYTNQYVIDASPATALSILPIPPATAPSVMKIKGTVPRTYGLEHRIELQSPVVLPIPQIEGQQNVTGNPGLWMLPPDLVEKALAGVTTLYEILATQQGAEAGSQAKQIDNSTFGVIIPFKVKWLDDNGTQFNLLGVDTDQRNLLLLLSNWLRQQKDDKTAAYLLLSPSPDAANTAGVTVLPPNAINTVLVKTNLSTIAVPPSLLMAGAPIPDPGYFASMASLADFLVLLWEGSVVGGTGYYFSPGQKLPGGAFDEQGNIVLQLLVIPGTQQSLASNGRSLLPFNNCALIGPGIDSSQLTLFIQSNGNTDASETVTQALVPAGNVGFDLLIANPEMPQETTITNKELLLKTMYSLLTFRVAPDPQSPFEAPPSGMPVLPNPSDGRVGEEPWQAHRALRKAKAAGLVMQNDGPKAYWYYSQVMPVSRFIASNTKLAAPKVNGLPPAKSDPYQGFGTQTSLPTANFVFGFGDVLGNRTGDNAVGQGTTPIKVGYTDNMVGIGDWPSTARYFTVEKAGNDAQLTVVIAPRASEMLPTPSQSGDVNADTLVQQQEKFSQSYYQLIQTGVSAWVVSSLNFIADANYGNKGVKADINLLWRFAAASYAVTSSLSLLKAAKPEGCVTVGDIITKYNVRYAELAMANAETLIEELFGVNLPIVPAYFPNVEHVSITELSRQTPKGWPASTPTEILMHDQNNSHPLRVGATLIIPAKTFSTGAVVPTPSVESLAGTNFTTIADIVNSNYEKEVLQRGFQFTVEIDTDTEVVVTVDDVNNSFKKIVDVYAGQGVQVTGVALANLQAETAGMFAADKFLDRNIYIVKAGDTLSVNSSGASSTELVNKNLSTPDLFDPGALIYFGNFGDVTDGGAAVTLKQFAERYACPAELLLINNAGFTLPAGSKFVVPGTLAWPVDTSAIRVPYTIQASDTLTNIASRFSFNTAQGTALMQLATLNENMPGTMLSNIDVNITISGTTYKVNTGTNPSFASVLTTLQQQYAQATFQDLINSIGTQQNVLNAGGLLISTTASFTQNTIPQSIPATYNVSAGSFALANTAMQNIIAPGVELEWPAVDPKFKVTTADNDTFNSLITKFADQGVTLSADQIVDANPGKPLIKGGAIALLPPAPVSFKVNLGQGGPYATVIGPLQVSVRLLRPAALIYPGFETPHGTGPVEMAESEFPAPVKGKDADSSLTYDNFVKNIKLALPQLRLGTGQITGVEQDLWQVEFDDNGIKKVELVGATLVNKKPQPRFFALKPLYKHLVTRTIPIAPLTDKGILGVAVDMSFQSVDTELWARRFVEDMDRFLSGPYAMAVYNDAAIRPKLKAVMDAKNSVIPKIAAGLNTVLNVTDPDKAPALTSAVDAMQQQLGVSLAKAYEAAVMIQYDSIVDSAWQRGAGLKPANLYGQGDIVSAEGSRVVPGLTMIAAKADLSKAKSYVNFLMMLDNPAFHKDVSGNFIYNISHLEFNINSDNVPKNYNASDWLTFVPLQAGAEKPAALQKTDPGSVDVPIPLRNFPDLPQIVIQQAEASYPDEVQDPGNCSRWNYEFVYTHQHAEQDYVMIKADFNLKEPSLLAQPEAPPKDLFTELAQYVSVADQLWTLLNALPQPGGAQDPNVANAVGTFASLATNISDYWSVRLPQEKFYKDQKDLLVALKSYSFNARVSYRSNKDLESITLAMLDGSPGPNSTWPDVYVQKPDGLFLWLDKEIGQTSTTYKVPQDEHIPPVAWPVFKIVWTDLNLAAIQNARSQMNVQRNQNLLDDVATNPDFIFTTDTVIAPSVITPLNNFSKRISINAMGGTLTDALNACFTALFAPDTIDQKITVELRYGFELVPPSGMGDEGLVTYLPIGLYPNQKLSLTTAADLNAVVEDWKRKNNPVERGGEWVFSLKLYSQITANTHTLMNIEHLVYKIVS